MFMKIDLPGREADLELNFGGPDPSKKRTTQRGADYRRAIGKVKLVGGKKAACVGGL
jgi:hypothetical protein